jgi:hypothetical protein
MPPIVAVAIEIKEPDEPTTLVSVANTETVTVPATDDLHGHWLQVQAALERLIEDVAQRAKDQVGHYTERAERTR